MEHTSWSILAKACVLHGYNGWLTAHANRWPQVCTKSAATGTIECCFLDVHTALHFGDDYSLLSFNSRSQPNVSWTAQLSDLLASLFPWICLSFCMLCKPG